jgi:Flp pilus assembly protein TadG
MPRKTNISSQKPDRKRGRKLGRKRDRKNEDGIIITLVAVFMLCVVGAMAALSIDVVTIYTARSEAQLAADSAALAAARVIANSGATSDPTGVLLTSVTSATGPAQNVAIQVAEQNQVGGTYLLPAKNISAPVFGGTYNNPTVSVKIQVTNLPTFFARIWGTKTISVSASATAEAYNPSGGTGTTSGTNNTPVAPICVKPWLLPNIDPSNTAVPGSQIFDPTSGAIKTTTLLGSTSSIPGPPPPMQVACNGGNCTPPLPAPTAWQYYPGDTASTFTAPTQSIPVCTPAMNTDYEKAIAGCVQAPIACNSTANIDTSAYGNKRYHETARAVNCLTHSATNGGDKVYGIPLPNPLSAPFEFVGGNDNPIPGAATNDVMVSDSLVTVPVFDTGAGGPPPSQVQIIGFVQLFLSPTGAATQAFAPPPTAGQVTTTVINLAGCGTNPTTASAIVGNGASPVAVRLISQPATP